MADTITPSQESDRKRQVDSELPAVKLSPFGLTLNKCYVTEVLAFPSSLGALRHGILQWNATCWLDQFTIPQPTMRKIADHCKTPTLHQGQICEFKGSPWSCEVAYSVPDIRLLVVFPHMKKPFHSEEDNEESSKEVQKIWTDEIVLPSIYRHVGSSVAKDLPTSYESLRLDSEVKRIELGLNVNDTPLCVTFRSDSLDGLWEDIVRKTKRDDFKEFSGAFLVAIGQWPPTATFNESVEGAWKTLADKWDMEMDMNYIPTETFEVRIGSEFRLAPRT
jgi:hypothetical protein